VVDLEHPASGQAGQPVGPGVEARAQEHALAARLDRGRDLFVDEPRARHRRRSGTRARDGVVEADGRPAQQPSPRRRGEHPQPRTQERDRVRVVEQPVLRRPRRLERALQRDGLRREARSVLHSE